MIENAYSPGLHKLVTLEVENIEKLISSENFIAFFRRFNFKIQLRKSRH
jgi:S-adenosylmethionine decarboxylase